LPEPFNAPVVYGAFMQEIRRRLDDIHQRLGWIADNQNAEAAVFEAELAFLHTRFVCELVALSSLSAHYSYGLNKHLLKAYRADNIFARLAGVNQYCFPVPIVGTKGSDGKTHFEIQEERRMTTERLGTIYNQVDNALHRGRLKHAVSGDQKVYDLVMMAGWKEEFLSLLSQHLILFPEEERALLVFLDGDDEGNVQVVEAKAGGPFTVEAVFAAT